VPEHDEKKVRYGVNGSMWTILPVCWPSVHILEGTLVRTLLHVDMARIDASGQEIRPPFAGFYIGPLNQIGAHIGAPRMTRHDPAASIEADDVERIHVDIDAHGEPWNGPAALVPTASDVGWANGPRNRHVHVERRASAI
jgi:hypothetical protein